MLNIAPFHLDHTPEPTPAPPDPLELLDARDVARLLRCHVKTLWTWVSTGVLPRPLHIGPRVARWRRSSIEQFLQDCEGQEE